MSNWKSIPSISNGHLTFLADRVNNTTSLSPRSSEEIEREIENLNTGKSSGPDNIGANVLKLCPQIFGQLLSKIYTKSVALGEYLTLFKKGQKIQPNIYRPISLLSCFNKLLENNIVQEASEIPRNQYEFI